MLSRFCLQVLWIQRLCSCSPAKPMIPEDHRVRGIYPVCRSASCTRTTGVSSSQSRATSAFFVLHSAFEQLSPVLSRFYLQPLWIQRFCPCSPAKLMIPEDHRRGGISSPQTFQGYCGLTVWAITIHPIFCCCQTVIIRIGMFGTAVPFPELLIVML